MGSDPMVKKFFSHYAPRPLQQPQMPDMKPIKRSACNHIRHFSLLSFPPRQIRRGLFNNPSSFHSQLKTFYRSNFLFTIIPQPMSSSHFSHLAAPALTLWGRGKGNFVSLSCTRLVAWLFHRWRFAYPDFSHASPVF